MRLWYLIVCSIRSPLWLAATATSTKTNKITFIFADVFLESFIRKKPEVVVSACESFLYIMPE